MVKFHDLKSSVIILNNDWPKKLDLSLSNLPIDSSNADPITKVSKKTKITFSQLESWNTTGKNS